LQNSLAREAEKASRFVQKALRRAARLAFLWPDEAAVILQQGRSLTDFPASVLIWKKIIRTWLNESREAPEPEPFRAHFLTLSQAKVIFAAKPDGKTNCAVICKCTPSWSDGSGTIREMAEPRYCARFMSTLRLRTIPKIEDRWRHQ
jgi:hypothetical protein